MATPPTRLSYNVPASGNYTTSPTSFTTNAFDVTSGDIIVVKASLETASVPTGVTPSASGGTVTWTSRASQSAGGSTQAAAYCWTGAVGATATGITVTLNRPASSGLFWGMSATNYTGTAGVGTTFSGSNTTGSGAPSQAGAASCAANSAVEILVNDWNAVDGTTRTWLTINGSAESEALYFRDAVRQTVYGGYRADTGSAGSITQGLSTPSTMRWVAVGVEILGTTGGAPAIPPELIMAPIRR